MLLLKFLDYQLCKQKVGWRLLLMKFKSCCMFCYKFNFCCRNLRHNNIVSFYGATVTLPRVSIITEYCPGGSLSNYIKKNKGKIPFQRKLQMLLDISHGMQYLHAKNVIHRDLKSDNILVHRNDVAKVADFGISKLLQEHNYHTQQVGYDGYFQCINNC